MHRSSTDRVARQSHVATETSSRKPPDRRVRGINTLPEGAPEAGDGDRTRHAPATLALAVALLLGSPDVSETHVCSEVCDACGATLKGLPVVGGSVQKAPSEEETELKLRYHNEPDRSTRPPLPVFANVFLSAFPTPMPLRVVRPHAVRRRGASHSRRAIPLLPFHPRPRRPTPPRTPKGSPRAVHRDAPQSPSHPELLLAAPVNGCPLTVRPAHDRRGVPRARRREAGRACPAWTSPSWSPASAAAWR